MEEKLVTLVVLPFSNAQILKARLEAVGIECDLDDIDLLEGSSSFSVQVKIMEKDIRKAFPVMSEFLGKKPEPGKQESKNKNKKILVPIDFSKSSENALETAFVLAGVLNRAVTIMHCYNHPVIHTLPFSDVYVYDSFLLAGLENADKIARENFQKFISEFSQKLGEENWNRIKKEFIIKPGFADDDILSYAEKQQPLFIVMGTKGDKNPINTVGSITADVMYNARVPVLVVPGDIPSIMNFSKLSKVVYATNFDEKDFTVLDKLLQILKPFKTRLICAHVGQPTESGWDLARLEGMKDILHKKYNDLEFECRLIVGKNTQDALEKYFLDEKVDVLALTTHKRNMISQLFNPSLARKMTYHAKTPLLIFHA